jgi:anti-sigma regulatory factor (Ser/Thr protein kinase)
VVRGEFTRELLAAGVSPDIVDDAVLVISELVGNSIRHARALPSGRLAITCEHGPAGVTIGVTDGGGPCRPQPRDASPYDTAGRGLAIVAALADDWGVSHGSGTVTVWARMPERALVPI